MLLNQNRSNKHKNKENNMYSTENSQNYILDHLKSNRNKYVPFIVNRRQIKLIEILDDKRFDANITIEESNQNFYLVSLNELVNGSFKGKSVNGIYKRNGCKNINQFSEFKSLKSSYDKLKRLNYKMYKKSIQNKY